MIDLAQWESVQREVADLREQVRNMQSPGEVRKMSSQQLYDKYYMYLAKAESAGSEGLVYLELAREYKALGNTQESREEGYSFPSY